MAHIRVPRRLLLKAAISFSEVYGSSGCRAAAASQVCIYVTGRDVRSGKKMLREGLYLLSISGVQGEVSTSRMIPEVYFRARSSLTHLQTKERLWTGMIMIPTVPVLLLSVWGINSTAFLLLLSDCIFSERAEVLLQLWKLFLLTKYGGR